MQYVLNYNGIQLSASKLNEHSVENEYSEDGVDVLYRHWTISMQGLVNSQLTGLNNADYLRLLRTSLQEPRKPLTFSIDGIPELQVTGIDAKNGPIPKGVRVLFVNGSTISVEITIECWVSECDRFGNQPSALLTNRWKMTHDINADAISTVTLDGHWIVRSDAATNPDAFRGAIFPVGQIPKGFTRSNSRFIETSDGLRVDYTVIWSEQYRPPTTPVTTWQGTWSEESGSDLGQGAVILGTLAVDVAGAKDANKDDLFNVALAVMRSRILPTDIMRAYRFQEALDKNAIRLDATCITVSNKSLNGLPTTTRIGFKVLPFDDPAKMPTIVSERGTFLTQLFISTILPTCADKTTAPTLVTGSATGPTTNSLAPVIYKGGITTDATTQISTDQLENAYIKTQLETRIKEDNHTVQLAPAVASGEAVICQLAAPTSVKIVRFSTERLGKQAVAPQPVISDGNHVVKELTMDFSEPELLPDGIHRIYRTSGEYIFYMKNTAQLGTKAVVLPKSPNDSVSISDPKFSFEPSDYQGGLIG